MGYSTGDRSDHLLNQGLMEDTILGCADQLLDFWITFGRPKASSNHTVIPCRWGFGPVRTVNPGVGRPYRSFIVSAHRNKHRWYSVNWHAKSPATWYEVVCSVTCCSEAGLFAVNRIKPRDTHNVAFMNSRLVMTSHNSTTNPSQYCIYLRSRWIPLQWSGSVTRGRSTWSNWRDVTALIQTLKTAIAGQARSTSRTG